MPNPSLIPPSYRHRGFRIEPKRDFGAGRGYLVNGQWIKKGYVVVKDACNVMPGAAWFQTVAEAKRAIDVLIAVGGESPLFWEILQPFSSWPGDTDADSAGAIVAEHSISCGRFSAKALAGRVVSTTVLPRAITRTQFLGLRELLKRQPALGLTVFSLGLTLPVPLTLTTG